MEVIHGTQELHAQGDHSEASLGLSADFIVARGGRNPVDRRDGRNVFSLAAARMAV